MGFGVRDSRFRIQIKRLMLREEVLSIPVHSVHGGSWRCGEVCDVCPEDLWLDSWGLKFMVYGLGLRV